MLSRRRVGNITAQRSRIKENNLGLPKMIFRSDHFRMLIIIIMLHYLIFRCLKRKR